MKPTSASSIATPSHQDLSFHVTEEPGTVTSNQSKIGQHVDADATEAFLQAWSLLQLYSENLAHEDQDRGNRKTLPERLAAILVNLSDQEGLLEGVHNQAIADCLGTYRENVSSILRAFRRQGLIQLGYRRIQILDMASLQEMARL